MKPCFDFWEEIKNRIAQRTVFLALDYDGVLSPIAAQPDLATLPEANRKLLEHLVRCPRVKLTVISGRSLPSVKERVQIEGLIYAGNHGTEIELNGRVETHVGQDDFRGNLSLAQRQLAENFSEFRGLLLEDKGFGVGLHYRELDPAQLDLFHQRFAEWARVLPAGLQIVHAKRMYEIRPSVAWNKGDAVRHIWQRVDAEAMPICLGDDLTDEDGFLALKGSGICIYVGEQRQSYAEYILHSTDEVTRFLGALAEVVR